MTQPPPQQPPNAQAAPQPQVIYSPGGLSSTAHAIHAVMTFCSFGLWGVVWIIHALMAPRVRTSVMVPYGQAPPMVQPTQATPRPRLNKLEVAMIWTVIGGFVIGMIVLSMLRR